MAALKRYSIGVAGLFTIWLLAAFLLVPSIIRSAYAGESLEIFNRVIRGQASIPLENYLGVWSRLARAGTAAFVVLALAGAVAMHQRARIAVWLRTSARALPATGAVGVVAFAVWAGALLGFLEAAVVLVRHKALHLPTGSVTSAEIFWLIPLAACTVFVFIALVVALADRSFRAGGVLNGIVPPLLLSLGVFSLLRAFSGGLHPAAAALLATGIGIEVVRRLARIPQTTARMVRRSGLVVIAFIAILAAAVPLWRRVQSARALAALPAAPADAPNVLVIVWDAARAQNLSAYGHVRATSPELERMAAQGILFERALAPAPWTLPTHASMFTGYDPHHLSTGWREALDDTYPTLAEVLADRGYATAGFAANTWYASRTYGLDRGFAVYDDRVRIGFPTALATWWLSRATVMALVGRLGDGGAVTQRSATETDNLFLRWRSRIHDRPWFAFINLFDTHEPYIAPPPWDRTFTDRRVQTSIDPARPVLLPQELEELELAYDACIRYLDAELRRVLDALDADGSLDRTLVILTSDHGEQFGEHRNDITRHGLSLYMPVLHVPLVLRYPPIGAGIRRPELVSLRDLPATIMAVVAADEPAVFPGRSLLHTPLQPQPILATVQKHLQADVWAEWPSSAGDMHSVFVEPWHYIRDARGNQFLFDIVADFKEFNDLAGLPALADTLARMRSVLDSLLAAPPATPRPAGNRPD